MRNRNMSDKEHRLPMNLQFFAEPGEGDNPTPPTNESGDNPGAGAENKPSYEDLIAQIAQERADKEKYKNLSDKYSKEAATHRKQLEARLSAEEKEDIAKQEAAAAKEAEDKAKDDRIAELEMREKVRDCTEYLMDSDTGIGMDKKTAKDFAEAFINGNFDKSLTLLGKHIKAIRDSAYQQALDDRPGIKAGAGDADKNALANEKAITSAKRTTGVNTDIINQYQRR